MITEKDNATMMGVSDLRQNLERILEAPQNSTIVIEKHHKPLAVLISDKEYKRMQHLLDMAEDIVLGFLAEERFKKSKNRDFTDIETVFRSAVRPAKRG